MKNVKTFEGFLNLFKSKEQKRIEHLYRTQDLSISDEEAEKRGKSLEREELEEKTRKSISIAQMNSSPTYYDHITKSTETTPSISSKRQSLKNVRRGIS